jgi:hypothetical protein
MPETTFTTQQLSMLKNQLEDFRAAAKKDRVKIMREVHKRMVGAQGRSESPLEYKASQTFTSS